MSDATPNDDARALLELEETAHTTVLLPADAHVIGEPVTVLAIRYPGLPRAGLLAVCRRGDFTYELSLADVSFPATSAGAALVAQYRAWLGLSPLPASVPEATRAHKVEGDDIVIGRPVELLVLACKSNALRCRLLGSTREVTLRTAVRDEIPGVIVTVEPRKQWTHARHPYLSGEVSAIRVDATVLGLEPLAMYREDARSGDGRPTYRLASDDAPTDLVLEARECIEARAYPEADELLDRALALDLRCLDAHALLGERSLAHWPPLALHHFELGVAIGSLTVGEGFDGVLPWGFVENRPFLRCLHGQSRALLRSHRREDAACALRRLLRLDPSDPLDARSDLAAIEAGT